MPDDLPIHAASPDPSQGRLGEATNEFHVIPVVSEQAHVHVLREHTGTLRVRKVIHESAGPSAGASFRETVETTRVPVNQVVESIRSPWQQGDVLVVPVYEERLVKQIFLLEEIHIFRRREAVNSGVETSLRREEVIVERLDPATGQWRPEVY